MQKRKPKAHRLRNYLPCSFEPLDGRILFSVSPVEMGPSVSVAAAVHPSVADVTPTDKQTGVSPDTFIACNVNLVGVGKVVDSESVKKPGAVTLTRDSDGVAIPGEANTTGGGDAIVFTPAQQLDLNTKYRFRVTSLVKDTSGNTFTAFTSTFTTSLTPPPPPPTDIRFTKHPLQNATGKEYTAVAVGPDHRLYVADLTGFIIRYDILDDGTLGQSKTIGTVRSNNIGQNGGKRLITGLLFAGSKKHPDVYVSHGYSSVEGSPDFTGKISKLTGSNLETYKDLVVNLPRSAKDHLTNQMAFGPDGAIYFCQASMTAMGRKDNTWGLRDEHMLTASILRLDLSKLGSGTLDAKTAESSGGTYDPFAANAPLTIYADGVRNSYDLVWTGDGHLFAATNGSASGGNTPAANPPYTGHRLDGTTYTGPSVPAESAVKSQPDFLYDVEKNGYYGHPNPLHDEYVLNGGNPSAGTDPAEVLEYPEGTLPDTNYQGFAFNFGQHQSPDGFVEYKSNAFGGKLKGRLLVTQYSGGDNVVALKRSGGSITSSVQNIVGFTGFIDPLDIAEDTASGNLYVAEFGGKRITLLRPDESALAASAKVTADQKVMYFNDVKGGLAGPAQVVIVKNSGGTTLTINQLTLTGDDPGSFTITSKPPLPVKLAPGASIAVQVAFKAASGATTGIHTGTLRVKSTVSDYNIALRGYATTGQEGTGEPSLQRLMDLYQIPIKVGDSTPDNPDFSVPPAKPNNEVTAQTLVRADATKLVTIEPLASFSPKDAPLATVGYYSAKDGTQARQFDILDRSYQQVDVRITGTQQFSPGKNPFGLYVASKHYNHTIFSEDARNKFAASIASKGRMMRFYPLKTASGATVANAYVVAVEFAADAPDQNDAVFIIRNVKPTSTAASPQQTPPAPPAGLRVLGTAGAISLDWDSPGGEVAGYVVKRSTNSKTNFIQLNSSLVTNTDFVDSTGGQKKYYYRVFTQDDAGTLSDPAKISATVTPKVSTPAPAGLISADIGNPTPAGTTTPLSGGTAYDMTAGGSDIQFASDQFRFAYQKISGDFDVLVRVASLVETDVWTKAGIMARASLAADSANVYALTSPTKYRLTYRTDNAGQTTATGVGTPAFPNNWLRLARSGNSFTGYTSTDGVNWALLSSVQLNLPQTIFVGLAATSHNPAAVTTAQFRDLSIA